MNKPLRSTLLVTAVLAALAGTVQAQAPATSAPPAAKAGEHRHGAHHDPAQRQQRMEQRLGELKGQLQLTPAQEGAWNAFSEALRPSAGSAPRLDREALAAMTTPQRIDQMRAMRSQHQAEMDRRAEASKAFYAALTPEQQKTFDAQSLRAMGRGGAMGPMGSMGGMDGHGHRGMHRHSHG